MVTNSMRKITVAFGALALLAGTSFSAVITWNGGGADNNWSTANNWSSNTVPGAADDVVFDLTSEKACTLDISTTIFSFDIQDGTTTITLNPGFDLTVTNKFNISSGTFIAGSNLISVGGDWHTNPNRFFAQTSTVVFTSSSSLTGETTFYGLKAVTAGTTLFFQLGSTTSVQNMVEFRDIFLRSTSPGNQWSFHDNGSSQTLVNLDVKDSDASGGAPMSSIGSNNSGNNLNWAFGAPAAITNLSALKGDLLTTDGQIELSWTAPTDINSGGSPSYDLRYTETGVITSDGQFTAATQVSNLPTPTTPGSSVVVPVTGLKSGVTYYFAIKSSNSNGTSPLDNNGAFGEPAVEASFFWVQDNPLGSGNGLFDSTLAFGDIDNDGDLDLAALGSDGVTKHLIIYENFGVSISSKQDLIGLSSGAVAFGDIDNDGDLDLAAIGYDGSNERLLIYKNNGGATPFGNLQEPMGVDAGVFEGDLAFGDVDNDGDLDLAVIGNDGSFKRYIIFENTGVQFSTTPLQEPMGANVGLTNSSLAFGDIDNDGDLDLAVSGIDGLSNKVSRIDKNSGGIPLFTQLQDLISGTDGITNGDIVFGDIDVDGDLDLVISGIDEASGRHLRVYQNVGGGHPIYPFTRTARWWYWG